RHAAERHELDGEAQAVRGAVDEFHVHAAMDKAFAPDGEALVGRQLVSRETDAGRLRRNHHRFGRAAVSPQGHIHGSALPHRPPSEGRAAACQAPSPKYPVTRNLPALDRKFNETFARYTDYAPVFRIYYGAECTTLRRRAHSRTCAIKLSVGWS